MTRASAAAKTRPHAKAKVEKRIGRSAPPSDPWAARIRKAVYEQYHPWQADVANDNARRFSMLVGRGGGKTTAFKGRFLTEMAETSGGVFIYGTPTLGMAIRLLWEPLKRACTELGILDDVEFAEAPREGGKLLTFKRTGSQLKLFGADDKKQINLLRGQPFNGVACDEVGFWPISLVQDFVENVIEPRIGERDGWIGLASSPGRIPRGFFHDVTSDKSQQHRPYRDRDRPEFAHWDMHAGWSSHAWSLADVVKMPDAERRYPALCALRRSHLRIKARKYSDQHPTWLREYEGRWARDNTASVFQFDPEKNLWAPAGDRQVEGLALFKLAIEALPENLEWHYVLAADKGSPRVSVEDAGVESDGDRERRDPWAINIYAFAPADPEQRIMHMYFLERTGLYARAIAQLLLGEDPEAPNGCMPHDKAGGIMGMIGWPDAMVMDADASTIAELSNVYGLRFKKAERKPDYKVGAVELTNGRLTAGRVKAIKGSPLHTQLAELQWAEQESGALREDPSQANHSTDTLLYSGIEIEAMFDSGVVTRDEGATKEAVGYPDPMGLDEPADRHGGDKRERAFDSWMERQDDDWESA